MSGGEMSGFTECFRAVVYPWNCDHQGHLTTMHYVGFFDQSCWQLISAVGLTQARMRAERRGFVDVKQTLEYRVEQPVGSPIFIEGGLLRIGSTSFTHFHRMKNAETGDVAATSESVSVFFDLEARVKMAIPDDIRERMAALTVARDG
jgi:acyl-CoA thioester hydrolase